MDTGLSGKIVLITGAASGIGAATARAFAAEGAHLALVDRDEAGLKALSDELDRTVTHYAVADLASESGVESGFARYCTRSPTGSTCCSTTWEPAASASSTPSPTPTG